MSALKKHSTLIYGVAISIILLLLFLVLQTRDSAILKLDSKWLIVAGVPILIALFAGGYITKFKGFGVELEAKLKKTIDKVDLIVEDVTEEFPEDVKGSIPRLDEITEEERGRVKRLAFIAGKTGYYGPNAVEYYINRLSRLSFFEIRDKQGKFICLLPTDIFKRGDGVEYDKLDMFIDSLERNIVLEEFGSFAVTNKVAPKETLVNVLAKVRYSSYGMLPVVNQEGKMVGIVSAREIEKRIADEVLLARE
jgi:uncharacterized integral membrane protein